MAEMTQKQKREEFQNNFNTMQASKEGMEAFKKTFSDQSKAENLLSSGGGENLGTLEQELDALSAMNSIRESERAQAYEQKTLFDQDIKLGFRDPSHIKAAIELKRRKGIKSHRYDRTRKKRMLKSRETLIAANDEIRSLKENLKEGKGKAPLTVLQRVDALKAIYDKIRIADRNCAEAIALNKDEEKKLKNKAELTYCKSMMRMLEREMAGVPKNSRDYKKLKGIADLNLKVYNELMRSVLKEQEEIKEKEAPALKEQKDASVSKQGKEAPSNKEKAPVLVDEKAEELVRTNVRAFGSFYRTLNDKQYGKTKEPLWMEMRDRAYDLLKDWEKKTDHERGDALGDVLIAANKLLCRKGKKNGTDKAREKAAMQFRSFFKSVLNSMSTNCRVMALERIFNKVDSLDDDPEVSEELKKANNSVFAELAREDYKKLHPELKDDDNALEMIDDYQYRMFYVFDKSAMHQNNIRKLFGGTKDFMLANLKFDFKRVMCFNLMADDIHLDRFGNVIKEDEAKKEQWENLIKEFANADNAKALELQRRLFARVTEKPFDPEWISEKGYKKHAYEVDEQGQKIMSTQNFATYWKEFDEKKDSVEIKKWNAEHPNDEISDKDIEKLKKSKINKDDFLKQRIVLEKLPSITAMNDLFIDLTEFLGSLRESKGIHLMMTKIEIHHPMIMKKLYDYKMFLENHKKKCTFDENADVIFYHRDGSELDQNEEIDEKGNLIYNKDNPLMYKHEMLRDGLYERAKSIQNKGYLSGRDKHGDVLKRINTRMTLFTKVEDDAMEKLKELTGDKGDPGELKALETLYKDYIEELKIQAIEAETLFQTDVNSVVSEKLEGYDPEKKSGYYPEALKYFKQQKKINDLFDELEDARENFLLKNAGEAATAAWKKELADKRSEAHKKLSEVEKENTTAFDRVKKAYVYARAIRATEDFTKEEISLLEKNNVSPTGSFTEAQRNRVLNPFIQIVHRGFNGAYVTEFDKYKAGFNKRFKHAMVQGKEEEIKNIVREFSEKIIPKASITDTKGLDKFDPELIEQRYINTGNIDFEKLKLTYLSDVNGGTNKEYPLLRTGHDELKAKDPELSKRQKEILSAGDQVFFNNLINANGFKTEGVVSFVPEKARSTYKITADALRDGIAEKYERLIKPGLKEEEKPEEKPVEKPEIKPEENRIIFEEPEEEEDVVIQEAKAPVEAAWDKQFTMAGGVKCHIVEMAGGAQRTYFVVGEDEKLWAEYKDDPVEFGFTAAVFENLSREKLAEMWKGKLEGKPDDYVPATEDLHSIRQTLIFDKLSEADRGKYDQSLLNNAHETGATYQLIKDNGLWDIYYLLDLTRGYHVYQQHKEQFLQKEQENAALRPEVKMRSMLPKKMHGYEKQTGVNCYGCAGSKIINTLLKENLLDQYKVRNFEPRYLSPEEYRDLGIDHDYEESRRDVEQYAGAGKGEYGNFFSVSDLIFDKKKYGGLGRRDVAVHKCIFNINIKNPNAQANMIEAMKAKIHGVLQTGQPLAFFSKGHYVTIVGLDNNRISYIDSLPLQHGSAITEDVMDFLKNIGDNKDLSTVELTWATKITPASLKELNDEYGGLGIDEKTGEAIRTNGEKEFEDIAHRAGIAIRKTEEKIRKDGNEDISHFMNESVCVHRGAFMTDEQFTAWEARDDAAWEQAKKDTELFRQQNEQKEKDVEKKPEVKEIKEKEIIEKEIKEVKPEVKAAKVEKESPESRYYTYRAENSHYETEWRNISKIKRYVLYGKEESVFDKKELDVYYSVLHCMRMFDPKLTAEDLSDRLVALERRKDKVKNASKFELSRNARFLEELVGKIMSFDIHKEFAAKDEKEMIELYFKYEPLFTLAGNWETIRQSLTAMVKSGDVPLALAEKDLSYVNGYMFQIDRFGKYYLSLIRGTGKDKLEAPDPEDVLVPFKMRESIAGNISEKWKGFDEMAEPFVKYREIDTTYKNRNKSLSDRMKTARRGETEDTKKAYDEVLGTAVMKAAAINGEDDGQAADMYRSLQKGEKEGYAFAAERVFRAVLSFDTAALKKEGLSSLMTDAKKNRIFNDAADVAPEVEKMVKTYRSSDAKGKVLKDDELDALLAICSFLKSAKMLLNVMAPEVEEAVAEGRKEKSKFSLELDRKFDEFYAALEGKTEGKVRPAIQAIDTKYEEFSQSEREKAEGDLNERLKAPLPEFAPVLAGAELFGGYVKAFKPKDKYTYTRRVEEMKTKDTELFNKNRFAKQLTDGMNTTKDRIARARRMINFNVRAGLSDESFKAISAFFTDNKSDNCSLVRGMSGKEKLTSFNNILSRFLSINTEGLDISNDEALSNNAGRLEEISLKVQGMKTLLSSDPSLTEMLKGHEGGLYDRVMQQMDYLGALSDHYRARRLVMTDSYFLSHYNEEISMSEKKGRKYERDKIARLLRKSRDTAAVLESLRNGKKMPHWLESGSDAAITVLEEEHKTRAFKDGLMDTSLINVEAMRSLLQEIKKFHSEHPGIDIRQDKEEVNRLIKDYSQTFKDMINQINNKKSRDPMEKYVETLMPGAYGKLENVAMKRGDDNRLAAFDNHMHFTDPATGEEFSYSSDMKRDFSYFVQFAPGQMMSTEEVLEMYEGLNVSNWKDIDYSDPVEAAAAKDLYLKSFAKTFKSISNEQKRIVRSYGMLPAQLPPIALILATNGRSECFSRHLIGNASDDIMRDENGAVMRDGRKMKMQDFLVERGYLSKEFVEEAFETSDLQTGISNMVNSIMDNIFSLFNSNEAPEEYEIQNHMPVEFCDSVNSYRGKQPGPSISADDERRIWVVTASVTAETGFAEQGKFQQEANFYAIRSDESYTRSMAQINRFMDNLKGVDTPEHSRKYKYLDRCLNELYATSSRIAKNSPPDGKDQDPESKAELRESYETTIRAARDYLKGKNRDHSNPFYRRRYQIVDELIAELEKDIKALGEENKAPGKKSKAK